MATTDSARARGLDEGKTLMNLDTQASDCPIRTVRLSASTKSGLHAISGATALDVEDVRECVRALRAAEHDAADIFRAMPLRKLADLLDSIASRS